MPLVSYPFSLKIQYVLLNYKDSVQRPSAGVFSSKIPFKKIKRFPYANDLPLSRGGLCPRGTRYACLQ